MVSGKARELGDTSEHLGEPRDIVNTDTFGSWRPRSNLAEARGAQETPKSHVAKARGAQEPPKSHLAQASGAQEPLGPSPETP